MKKAILVALASAATLGVQAQKGTTYAPNIVRIYPISAFVYGGVGAGLSYERIVTTDGKVGVNIPVFLGLNSNNQSYNSSTGISTSMTNFSVLVSSGVKFYPGGQRKVTYAIGASVFGAFGNSDYYGYLNNGTGTSVSKMIDASYVRAGIKIDNYLQFNITPKFNFGLEVGLGPTYVNHFREEKETRNEGINALANFGFHLGFRF